MLAGFKHDQMGLVAGVAAGLGLIPALALTYNMNPWRILGESYPPASFGIIASALVGLLVGWAMPLLRKPPVVPSPRVMDEKAWRSFLEDCQARNADPATTWLGQLKEPPNALPLAIFQEFEEPTT
jgi:hypothetical protein